MLNKNHSKLGKIRVAITLSILVLQFFIFPTSYLAAALTNVEAIVSNSRVGIKADLTLQFTTSIDIGANGYFEFTLDEEFNMINEVFCAGPNVTTATSSNVIRCTYSLSPGVATTSKVLIKNMYNPGTSGRYNVQMDTYDSGDSLLENGNAAVYITEAQELSAYVGSIITFNMDQEDVSEVNGVKVTGSSTATMIDFGNISNGASSTIAQTLNIRTNAINGFSCTVQQDHELVNESNDTINSFSNAYDGTGSSTDPKRWESPSAIADQDHTFGHLGLTSDDPNLSVLDYTGSKYVGLNGIEPVEVFYHHTATVNDSIGEGRAHIAYTLEISAVQEKGDYTNSLSYVCTGNF